MLRIRERRTNLLLLAQERSRELLLRSGFKDRDRDRDMAIKAKAKVDHPRVGDTLGLQAR